MHIYNSLFNNLFALQLFIAKSDPLPLRRTRICFITKSGYRTGWVVRLCSAWSLQPNPPKILYPRLVKDFSCNYFRNKGLIQSIFRALVYFPCLFLGKYDRPTDRTYGQELGQREVTLPKTISTRWVVDIFWSVNGRLCYTGATGALY